MSTALKYDEGGGGDFQLIKILLRGAEDWNNWRRKNPNEPINLYQADLRNAYLEGTNLGGADLEGANLERANLKGANLERANLKGADLEGANLKGADLEGANLERANLKGANLERANLKGADLERTNLKAADLERTNLEGANLERANIRIDPVLMYSLSSARFKTEIFEIYTESDSLEEANEIHQCLNDFYTALGFSIELETDWIKGSLYKKGQAVLRGMSNFKKWPEKWQKAVKILLGNNDLEDSIKLIKIIAELEKTLKGKKGAVTIRVEGAIFLRRSSKNGDGEVLFKVLTPDEKELLDNNPTLLRNQKELLAAIKDMQEVKAQQLLLQIEDNSDSEDAA